MNGIESYRELKPNKEVQKLIAYFGDKLTFFPQSNEFREILRQKKNEDQHSGAICVYMTNTSQAKFNFQREIAQVGSHTIDIGVYKGAILIFVIEAKILPTPEGTSSRPRYEHEYVYGHGAGIQRYKHGAHGVDNENNPFPDCGMLAYVKENDFSFWHAKVNQWILDAGWDATEQLQKVSLDMTAKFISEHLREDDSKIRLHHFWVYVTA